MQKLESSPLSYQIRSQYIKGTSTKKQQIGKLIHGQSLDVVDHKTKPKKPTLTSCKSIDLQVPQVTSERRHSLVGLNILLPEKKRFNLKRSKSTCDLDDQESIDKDKSDNHTQSKSDTENNENGKKLSNIITHKLQNRQYLNQVSFQNFEPINLK